MHAIGQFILGDAAPLLAYLNAPGQRDALDDVSSRALSTGLCEQLSNGGRCNFRVLAAIGARPAWTAFAGTILWFMYFLFICCHPVDSPSAAPAWLELTKLVVESVQAASPVDVNWFEVITSWDIRAIAGSDSMFSLFCS